MKNTIIEQVAQFMQSEIARYEQLSGDTIPASQQQYYARIFDRGDCVVVTGSLMIDYDRSWNHPALDGIAAQHGMIWEWETPEAIVLC